MTQNQKATKYNPDHSIYGGAIEIEDFNTTVPNKNRINNQIDANNLQNKLEDKRKETNFCMLYAKKSKSKKFVLFIDTILGEMT